MSKNLIKIAPRDWPKLRDLYVDHKDFSSAHNTLQIFINWYQLNPAVHVKIFTLDNDWQNDGTFVAFTSNQILCNTLDTDLARLTNSLKNFNAGPVYVIGGFPEHVLPAVKAYAEAQVVDFKFIPTIWYKLEEAKIKSFDVSPPVGIKIERLQSTHASTINSYWPHSWPSATKFIEDMIAYNENVGAFDAADNLVGWCLVNPIGHVAVLHVIDSYKRLGIGSLLVRSLAQKLLQQNLEVLTSVINENVASRALFEKLGFEAVDNAYWAFPQLHENK